MSDWKGFKHRVKVDGDYEAVDNKDPSSTGMIASERSATPDKTTMNLRPTAVVGDDDKVALDVALSTGDGNTINEENPLPIYQTESPGDEIEDPHVGSDIAEDGVSNHDYVVSAAKTFKRIEAEASSSGFAKFQLQIETGVATGIYTTIMTKFNSTSNPNVEFKYTKRVLTGINVRVAKTNCDDDDTDLHSVIRGVEV